MLGEVSRKEEDKYHMLSLISGISHTARMNLFTEKKLKHVENRLVVAKGEGEGGGWMGSLGLPLDWTSHEVLLCSPWELCLVTRDGA